MIEEPTQERLKQLLNYDPETGVFVWKVAASNRVKVGGVAGAISCEGYRRINIDGRSYYGHRLAWLHCFGRWPAKHVDHVNGVRDDNRLVNLREATDSENGQNRQKAQANNRSRLLGVYWNKRNERWVAQIALNGKLRYLGLFDTAEDAHAAYLTSKKKLHPFSTLENPA